jgi:hypothetical protein
VFAPEEVYFPTLLSILGYLRPDNKDCEVKLQSITFAEFQKKGDANPITFSYLSKGLIDRCRDSGCLFARKFPKGSISLATWKDLIMKTTESIDFHSESMTFKKQKLN